MAEKPSHNRLEPFLSPLGAWSYGVGTAIGWGSLVVTSSQYLQQAGPVGSLLGMGVGMLIMVVISYNYAHMMNRYPDSGGSYTYVRHVLGHDYGFLIAWFLVLAYLSVFWANATSLPLFSRFFLGGFFKFGYLYTVFDYDVYIGEVLLTVSAISLVGLLCTRDKRHKQRIMIGLALLFTCGILVCSVGALLLHGGSGLSFAPLFVPDTNAISQVIKVSYMAPWAYIGFESISNSTEEFAFPRKHSFKVLLSVLITTTVLYVLVTLLSVTAYPPQYESWLAYLADLGNLQGIEGLPPFYAAHYYMGDAGLLILMGSLLALVLTSLIGNLVALSRLFVTLARDGVVPESFANLNEKGTPQRSILLITGISLLIPFLGRTPIGWIVDITTIAAVIVYGLVSLAELRIGRTEADRVKVRLGGLGFAVMAAFGLATLLPSLFSSGSLARETYLMVAVWSILGFAYFRTILYRDDEFVYGRSVIVWAFMLSLVLFSSTVWMQKADQSQTSAAFDRIQAYIEQHATDIDSDEEREFLAQQLSWLNKTEVNSSLLTVGMLTLSMAMMLSNNSLMRRRQERREHELSVMRAAAYRDELTGVKNKNAYLEWERDIDVQIADGLEEELVVIVFDVNGLKYINDTQGHKAGDAYIREACMMVCRAFAHSPVYRVGGDEFIAVPQGNDLAIYQDILSAFDRDVEANIGQGRVVVSAGYSILRPGLDSRFHDVFERADARMYQRKMQLKRMGAATRD